MAWVKVPAAHHPLFHAALPVDRRVTTIRMFGGIAALANGRIFGGLFARSILVRLDADAQREAMALDGSTPFDPLGNGRTMTDTVLLSEQVMEDPAEMRQWLARALAYTLTLPPKVKRARTARAATPAKTAPAKPRTARAKPTATRPAPAKAKRTARAPKSAAKRRTR